MARPAPVCIDANLIVAMVVNEPASIRVAAQWRAWAIENRRRLAPRVLPFEIARAIQRKIHEGQISRKQGRTLLGAAEKLIAEVELRKINEGLVRALDLAESLGVHLFDACYVAIAEQEHAELWTLDTDLAALAKGKVP